MTRFVAAFCRSLVVDPRSQRAIEETRLDACFEAAAAQSPMHRAMCHLRSIVALLRALVGSLPREIVRAPLRGLAWRLAAYAVVPAALLTALFFPYWVADSLPRATLFVALLSMSVSMFLPLAWLYALGAGRGRSTPALAAAGLAFFLQTAMLVFVLPPARRTYLHAIGVGVDGPLGSLGTAAAVVATLVAVVQIGTSASFAGAFALFATRVGSHVSRRRARWTIVLSATLLYIIGLRITMSMPALLTARMSVWPTMLVMLAGTWCATGVLVAVAIWLTRRSRTTDLWSATPSESSTR